MDEPSAYIPRQASPIDEPWKVRPRAMFHYHPFGPAGLRRLSLLAQKASASGWRVGRPDKSPNEKLVVGASLVVHASGVRPPLYHPCLGAGLLFPRSANHLEFAAFAPTRPQAGHNSQDTANDAIRRTFSVHALQ